ncbi:MAG: DUF4349 domain-containing protein [Acidobacteriales bacterium]|nr:DUF4349 domain-containing protein [Terriglobales bacterium]
MTAKQHSFGIHRFSVAVGFIACMGLWIVLIIVQESSRYKRISESRAAGLASMRSGGWSPVSLWTQDARLNRTSGSSNYVPMPMLAMYAMVSDPSSEVVDKKIIRRGQMTLTSESPRATMEGIQAIAESLGGFVVNAVTRNDGEVESEAKIQIRVPAGKLDEAIKQIRILAKRVEGQQVEASDVTKDFVDHESQLRNLRAQESQYLAILKQAKSVDDTLKVSEKLGEVRGEIEKTQGELNYLLHDVAMSSLQVEIRADAETKIFGVHWRPWYETKVAFRDGMQGLVGYFNAMIGFAFWLPTFMLWLVTLGTILIMSFRTVRWTWRKFGRGLLGRPVTDSGNKSPAPGL